MKNQIAAKGHILTPEELGAIKATLLKVGVKMRNNAVNLSSLRSLIGATMKVPEWLVLHDCTDTVPASDSLIEQVQNELLTNHRILLPASVKYANFGEFLDEATALVTLHGLVFQYALESSPRNICFGYKLFNGELCISENNSLATVDLAKQECTKAVKDLVAKLFDL
jgi:hypothetical protein